MLSSHKEGDSKKPVRWEKVLCLVILCGMLVSDIGWLLFVESLLLYLWINLIFSTFQSSDKPKTWDGAVHLSQLIWLQKIRVLFKILVVILSAPHGEENWAVSDLHNARIAYFNVAQWKFRLVVELRKSCMSSTITGFAKSLVLMAHSVWRKALQGIKKDLWYFCGSFATLRNSFGSILGCKVFLLLFFDFFFVITGHFS